MSSRDTYPVYTTEIPAKTTYFSVSHEKCTAALQKEITVTSIHILPKRELKMFV